MASAMIATMTATMTAMIASMTSTVIAATAATAEVLAAAEPTVTVVAAECLIATEPIAATVAPEGLVTTEPIAATVAPEGLVTTEPIAATVAPEGLVATESIAATVAPEGLVATEPSLAPEAVTIAEFTSEPVVTVAEAVEAIVASVKFRMPVVKVVPGTGANEHAACEPLRAPVTVGCAIKWIVGIEAVLAHRRRIIKAVIRADLHANGNLCLRVHGR
ncbi:MAG TPA: hypothetical protein VI685_27860 [Candidatus Angelobacter sp.]